MYEGRNIKVGIENTSIKEDNQNAIKRSRSRNKTEFYGWRKRT